MAEDAEDSVTVKEEELEEDEDGRSEANFSPVFIVPSSKEDELPRYQYWVCSTVYFACVFLKALQHRINWAFVDMYVC